MSSEYIPEARDLCVTGSNNPLGYETPCDHTGFLLCYDFDSDDMTPVFRNLELIIHVLLEAKNFERRFFDRQGRISFTCRLSRERIAFGEDVPDVLLMEATIPWHTCSSLSKVSSWIPYYIGRIRHALYPRYDDGSEAFPMELLTGGRSHIRDGLWTRKGVPADVGGGVLTSRCDPRFLEKNADIVAAFRCSNFKTCRNFYVVHPKSICEICPWLSEPHAVLLHAVHQAALSNHDMQRDCFSCLCGQGCHVTGLFSAYDPDSPLDSSGCIILIPNDVKEYMFLED